MKCGRFIDKIAVVVARRLLVTAMIATVGTFVVTAHAAQFFFDEASFQAVAGGGLSFQSFEGLTATNVRADRDTVGVAGFTLTSPNGNELSIFDFDDGGSHATDRSNYVLWGDFAGTPDTPTPNDVLVFDFSSPINAFSLILTDPLDLSPTGATIEFSNDLGETTMIATAPVGNGAEVFFGVISSGMTSISIRTSSTYFSGDRLGLDSVSFQVVPEPSSALLVGIGILGVSLRRRRK